MRTVLAVLLASLVLWGTGNAISRADDRPATATAPAASAPVANSEEGRKAEAKAAWLDAMAAATKGPAEIPFLSQAALKVPEGYVFVPVRQSNRLMRAWGNSAGGDGFLGLVFSADTSEDWFITVDYVDAGYVKDEAAKNWDTDALLKSAQDGVEADNEDRVARGFPKIKVDGWIEKPIYDSKQHRLVYSTALSAVDAPAGDDASVNYHTYALGREGYFALDLVTGTSNVAKFKDRAQTVLAALDYKPGKRYEDYVASTDRLAEYGIAALIGGIAAKKLGLLALVALAATKFGAGIIAFAKPLIAGVVALFAGVARFFRRKQPPPQQ